MKKFTSGFIVLQTMTVLLIYSILPVFSQSSSIFQAETSYTPDRNSPIAIQFKQGNQPLVSSFFDDYQQHFQLSKDNRFQAAQIQTDKFGQTHHRYNQYYKGIPVFEAQYILHEKQGRVHLANGRLIHGLDLDVTPTLSESAALAFALEEIHAETYMWELSTNEAFIKREQGDPNATFYPQGTLILTAGKADMLARNYRLAYRFDIYAAQPLSRDYIDIDAQTGEVLNRIPRIHDLDVPGSGVSLYNGTVNMTVDQLVPPSFRLQGNTTRGAAIRTFDMQNGTNYGAAVDFTSLTADGPWDAAGVSAHFGAEVTYDYFFNEHGRNSLDDAGFTLLSYVHYSSSFNNAFWDGSRMTYGDGDGVTFTPLVSLDVVSHELTHGITEFSANLIYQRESGALNESFSDIFGNLVEFEVTGHPSVGSGSWRIGEDITPSGAGIRNMENPNEHGDPDTYGGTFWFNVVGCIPSPINDQCGVHTNSGVQNFWFYLLSDGGSGVNDNGDAYNVTGIGTVDAAAIAYRNLTVYLMQSSTYQDARAGAINSAVDLFGTGSAQEQAVKDAWDAVGVYGPASPPMIDVFPTSFSFLVPANGMDMGTMTISNIAAAGADDLSWNIAEQEVVLSTENGHQIPVSFRQQHKMNPKLPSPQSLADVANYPRGSYAPSSALPPHTAKPDIGAFPGPLLPIDFGPLDSGFGPEAINSIMTESVLNAPENLITRSPLPAIHYAGAEFGNNGNFSFMYALDYDNNTLVTIDINSGAVTTLGPAVPAAGENWGGLAMDPNTGIMYAASTTTLYTVNLSNGMLTTIGNIASGIVIVAIAFDNNGQLYGLDVIGDNLLSINTSTGAGTTIGPLGYDANFSQGMDFDESDGTLYIAAFNDGNFQAELRIADPATGASSLVGALGSTAPGGLVDVSGFGIATGGSDCPWLSESPTNGSIAPGGSQSVDVIIDATGLADGTYNCNMLIYSNDPATSPVTVPVILTVSDSDPPDIDVSPTSFTFNVPVNGTDSDVLTISNTAAPGALDLTWSMSEQDITLQTKSGVKIPTKVRASQDRMGMSPERLMEKRRQQSRYANKTFGNRNGGISHPSEASSPGIEATPLTFFTSFDLRGGYVAKGTGMRGSGAGNITISGIPGGSTVVAAYLYWCTLDNATPTPGIDQGVFDGNNITGVLIGTDLTPCWPQPNSYVYWANVTPFVSGNGTYALSGFLDSGDFSAAPSCEGASLVIVYENSAETQKQIVVYDGNALLDESLEALNQTLSNFTAANPVTDASISYVVADGQVEFNEEVFFNGSSIAVDPFAATEEGPMRDTETYDVTSLVAGGSTFVTTDVVVGSDCVVIDAIVFCVSSAAVDCPWLAATPTSGTVSAGSSQNVDIMVDATGLAPGTYNCDLIISSNDPDENPVTVPVTLNVTDADMVTVSWCDTTINGTSGQQDTVYICVDDVTDKNIIAYQLTVGFDDAVLNCVSATSIGTISEPFGPPTVNCAISGEITVGGFGTAPLSGSGQLVCLIFDVVGPPGASTDLCINTVVFNAGDPVANIPDPCCPYDVLNNFDISGNVNYCPNGNPVPNADMTLTGSASGAEVTDASGNYAFLDLLGGLNYTVTPSKTGDADALFDISCFDAALAAQIAVGILSADHCDSLAADVDEDGNIFTFDAALICRYAVGFPPFSGDDQTGEWRFEPANRSYTPLINDQTNQDYNAALLGDVDGNWAPAASPLAKQGIREAGFEELNNFAIPTGEIISIPFMVLAGEAVISADIDFRYDPKIMRFIEVVASPLAQGFQIITNTNVEEGRIRVGAFATEAVSEPGELLALRFEVIGKERETGILNLDRYLVNGSTLKKGERSFVVGASAVPTRFALHPNYPNPFNPETNIRFDIPQLEDGEVAVRLSIYNTAGQLVRVLVDESRKTGVHEVKWDGRDTFGKNVSSGMYFYSISAGEFFQTRKMLFLK